MSTFSEYRILPSKLVLACHVIQHGLEVEHIYMIDTIIVTKEEYDALYPLSTLKEVRR